MTRPGHVLARLIAALVATAFSASARADSINCDRGIVSTGDSKLDLLAKCGEPALMEARLEERSHYQVSQDGRSGAGRSVTVTVERWTYNFGSTALPAVRDAGDRAGDLGGAGQLRLRGRAAAAGRRAGSAWRAATSWPSTSATAPSTC